MKFRQYFLTLSVFLIKSGKLFHRERLTNEIAFCPMLVLRKEILSSANFFFVSFLQREQIQNLILKDNKESVINKFEYID